VIIFFLIAPRYDVPLWAFYGEEDDVNEVKYTRMTIAYAEPTLLE
jgi:hypothetical protein